MKFRIGVLIVLVVAVGMTVRTDPTSLAREGGSCASTAWRGAGSCSAASCHGGDGPLGTKGSEYATWIARDPHARAYEVLFEPLAKDIVKNYYQLANRELAHPEKVTLCLKCHVDPALSASGHYHADGVSCESCHGAAEKWLARHYQPEWKHMSAADKETLGFRRTKEIAGRAQACLDCHVGTAGMDVNHDLIAAGHPRLAFEFAGYQANYPRHWDPRDDRARYPDFEARSWAIGQVVSARAAAELLASRAGSKDEPWPEFAETNCFACHQDLWADAAKSRKPKAAIGRLTIGDWYYAELPQALGLLGVRDAATGEVGKLTEEMHKLRRTDVAARARGLVGQLTALLSEAVAAPEIKPERVKAALSERMATKRAMSEWEQLAQDYLGAAALYQALGDQKSELRDPEWAEALRRRRESLKLLRSTRKWRE